MKFKTFEPILPDGWMATCWPCAGSVSAGRGRGVVVDLFTHGHLRRLFRRGKTRCLRRFAAARLECLTAAVVTQVPSVCVVDIDVIVVDAIVVHLLVQVREGIRRA